jgi:hypothetical protein
MYLCTSVCMYVCIMYIYICMYICMRVCMYVSTYVCMYVCMDVRLYPSVLSRFPRFDFRFRDICVFFTVRGRQPLAQPPTWRTRVSLSVWIIPFDLSGLGDPTSSYATAGIALKVIWPRKPHHYVRVETPSGGIFYLKVSKLRYNEH